MNPETTTSEPLAVVASSAPALPSAISNDGRELWKWAADAAEWMQRAARIKELHAAIQKCGSECGDCDRWMKSSECPRERPGEGKFRGHSVGPSMGDRICSAYKEKAHTTQRRAEYTSELAALLQPNAADEARR